MSDKFIKAAVLGYPAVHSKSPLIHNYWINHYGLAGSYEAITCAPENLKETIQRLKDEGYKGLNLTIPHKESVMQFCDNIDLNAQNIGAVNTVVIEHNGRIRGLNTDGFGFLGNIYESDQNFSFEYKCAVVLGAGGAARAVISALIGEQIEKIILGNRTLETAQKLAQDMDMQTGIIEVIPWEQRSEALKKADLLINTTSLGMSGADALEIDLSHLSSRALVNDIVYVPLETPLLKAARERGYHAVTGIGMLLHQARPAFNEWFGVMPEVTPELRDLVLK